MSAYSKNVVTRFAPSPTGFFHIGSARTALFNFIVAKQNQGKMILRIEDTDVARSKKEYEEDIIQGLAWLDISFDALYRQSERKDIYERYIKKLIAENHAYESVEEREGVKNTVIRFRNPNKVVSFTDEIRGNIEMATDDLGDFVIARSLNDPLYHLAVVIDDHEMDVSHVIRGEDHIANTPRQILLQEAIGANQVYYAHIPLVLAPDKSKLSKRHGALSVHEYKDEGYLPEALVNFMALLGWSPQSLSATQSEIFTLTELISNFSLSRVQKGGAVFNISKLNWINKEHIKRMSAENLIRIAESFLPSAVRSLPQYSEERLRLATPVLLERIEKFSDIQAMAERGELDYFFSKPNIVSKGLLWQKEIDFAVTKKHIDKIIEILHSLSAEQFTAEKVKDALWEYATDSGRGSVLWPMRYALSGKEKSPDPFALSSVLGKEESIARLAHASEMLQNEMRA